MNKNIDGFYRYHLIALLTICVLCAIIYSNTVHSPFVFDDLHNIVENPNIRLTSLNLQNIYDAGFKSPSPRPTANISFAMNYYFGRYDVVGYHLVNIIIHLINGILVYFLAFNIFSQIRPPHAQQMDYPTKKQIFFMSLYSALLFVAHPLQTQSVTYIVQRMNSMSVMFFLLSFFFYIRGRLSQTNSGRWVLYFGCFVSWILALGSKQIAVTLPFIVILYEWYFFQDFSTAWLRRNVKYFFMLVAVVCLFAFIYLGINPIDKILASYERRDFTVWERLLTQPRVVIFYISLLFFPHPSRLNLCHNFTTSHSLVNPITTLLSLLTILGLMGLALCLARKHRFVSFGIVWFLVNLALESSVIGLEMIFEHRTYLPSVLFSLVIVFLFYRYIKIKWLINIALCLAVVQCAVWTYDRNEVWKDGVTFWRDCVKKSPQDARPHTNLGKALIAQGSIDEAINQSSIALQLNPEFAEAHNNLGVALAIQGSLTEAIRHYSEALRIEPRMVITRLNLGAALLKQGNSEEAVRHYKKVLRIDPNCEGAYFLLGNALLAKERIEEAIFYFQEALRINPDFEKAHINMGYALFKQGKEEEAIMHYHEAIRIDPDKSIDAYYNLACVYAKNNAIQESIGWLKKSIDKGFDDWELLRSDKDLENIRNTTYYIEITNMR